MLRKDKAVIVQYNDIFFSMGISSLLATHPAHHRASQRLPLSGSLPISPKASPSSDRLLRHLQFMHNQIVMPVAWQLSPTHVPTHRDIQNNPIITHQPGTLRYTSFHHRIPINIPNQSPTLPPILPLIIPRKRECMWLLPHGWYRRIHSAVLIPVFTVVVPPMQATVIDIIPIPTLEDVHLPIRRPAKRFLRQQPKRRPDPARTWRRQYRREASFRSL